MVKYNKVIANISLLPDFIQGYEKELIEAKEECKVHGLISKQLSALPGNTEHRFNQLQEIEAVLNYMNLELRKKKQIEYKKFLETYAKALTSRDAERYAYAEDSVIDYEVLINEVAYLRNQYLGILKAFESKNFQLGHIARLHSAGMEDVQA